MGGTAVSTLPTLSALPIKCLQVLCTHCISSEHIPTSFMRVFKRQPTGLTLRACECVLRTVATTVRCNHVWAQGQNSRASKRGQHSQIIAVELASEVQ